MNPFHKFKNADKHELDKSISAYHQAERNWNEAQVIGTYKKIAKIKYKLFT